MTTGVAGALGTWRCKAAVATFRDLESLNAHSTAAGVAHTGSIAIASCDGTKCPSLQIAMPYTVRRETNPTRVLSCPVIALA